LVLITPKNFNQTYNYSIFYLSLKAFQGDGPTLSIRCICSSKLMSKLLRFSLNTNCVPKTHSYKWSCTTNIEMNIPCQHYHLSLEIIEFF
jgi:hypothetical protein